MAEQHGPPPPGLGSGRVSAGEKKSQGFGGETKDAKFRRYAAYVAAQNKDSGLSADEVAARRLEFGMNALDGADDAAPRRVLRVRRRGGGALPPRCRRRVPRRPHGAPV